MARHATIIGRCRDHWGDSWDVRESRPMPGGGNLLIGWPEGHRGQGCGGPRVILTTPLVKYLERHRLDWAALRQLPIGATTRKRLRRILGHDRYDDAAAWWEERVADLSDLTIEEFARRHGRTVSAVERARLALLGKTLRDAGWYREPEPHNLLVSDEPRAYVADTLGISVGSVGRLRWTLRREQTE